MKKEFHREQDTLYLSPILLSKSEAEKLPEVLMRRKNAYNLLHSSIWKDKFT